MTDEERWAEIEEHLHTIGLDVQHRCYDEHSVTGVRYVQMLVRRNLVQIDKLLLEDLVELRRQTKTAEE